MTTNQILTLGETKLFSAVIAQAKEDIEQGNELEFKKAASWAFSHRDQDRPGTISWFAEQLGWDPARLRLALRHCVPENRKEFVQG